MSNNPKIFVLDTNVLLHDHKALSNFQENDIVIPIIVLEELDKFKKGNDQINFNAREFARELDKILGDKMLNGWIGMGPGRGRLKVELGHPFPEVMEDSFYEDTPDHRILVVAQYMKENNPDRRVILITKDVNLRIKSKALSIEAQDYMNDKVRDESIVSLSKGVIRMNRVTPQTMAKLYQTPEGLSAKDIKLKGAHNNQYYVLKNKDGSALARYEAAKKRLVPVPNHRAYGITPRNQEQNFALDALLNPSVSLVSLTGIAGTGKTLLALAAALAQEDDYDQVLLSRPVIPLKNQEMGFLPGDIKEKLAPYMLPLMDNLSVIKGSLKENSREQVRIEEMLKTEKLLISPLAYIRGRSLSKVFFIVDESQNLTPHEVKTIITRAGEGSKLVFTGDIHQIDQPYLDMHSNGLTYLTDKMLGQDLFAHVNLVKGERSRLAEVAGNIL
ncbi:MAG: PhoH family protein [Bacteroidales bacterium]|jgi:PhoH-like ATPase|nr:PhoH family protein [Bacteroidales bacterium]MDD3549033.1 PhoH family protein [Bacteroidales bacterium]MDD4064701.1 PhoH family protein [Bacteroidales bacterium]MDD4498903.1 PhoH family protein [Bacteroidales bacterium]MDD5283376.1 PhoH family protein [Bacteroidales bacterium]